MSGLVRQHLQNVIILIQTGQLGKPSLKDLQVAARLHAILEEDQS